jgi:hypothetical protein
LDDAVADSRNRQWPLLGPAAGLRNEYPAGRERPVAAVLQIRSQLLEELGDAVLLDIGDGPSIDAGGATIGADLRGTARGSDAYWGASDRGGSVLNYDKGST